MGVCNVCMHMLHDFTDAWNMIVCTVCPVLFLTWVSCYETTLGISYIFRSYRIPYHTAIRKWLLCLCCIHSMYQVYKNVHCIATYVGFLECLHLHTTMPRYT